MSEKDLSKYNIRTDLIMDIVEKSGFEEEIYESCKVKKIDLNKKEAEKINKKEGKYITIYFEDITDNKNNKNVEEVLIKKINEILENKKITKEKSCLIIGLGNEKSTADALGVISTEKCIITKHIYDLTGTLEEGYRITSSITPGVMGTTGIETSDIIKAVIDVVKPDFIIAIDALASDSLNRLLKTIQITDAGINPGSGIGNDRKELSEKVYNIPVIAIGVPTVVEASTIVTDTIYYLKKHLSYNIKNNDNNTNKLIPNEKINYLKNNNYSLSKEEENYFLGQIGTLSKKEEKKLIKDVLSPINQNLIVTPKEIDFILEKLTDIISNAINKSIHEIK